MKRIVEILKGIRPENDFVASIDFIEDGLLDSFDILILVSELDRSYQISIGGTDIVPQNFCSVNSIGSLLTKYGVSL